MGEKPFPPFEGAISKKILGKVECFGAFLKGTHIDLRSLLRFAQKERSFWVTLMSTCKGLGEVGCLGAFLEGISG